MTFTEWYKHTKGEEWHEDYALMYGYADAMTTEYEDWCDLNGQEPVWDG